MTRPKSDEALAGLVYSLTPKVDVAEASAWYMKPVVLGVIMITGVVILDIIFR
jgi:hypothetical protein